MILAAVVWLAPTAQSHAIVLAPQPVETSLPEKWRAPLDQLLRDLGAKDVRAVLESTKTAAMSSEDRLILRVEHESACAQDLCMTIVGQLKDNALQPLAMFFAGKWITNGDVSFDLVGTSLPPPRLFFSTSLPSPGTKYVAAFDTPRGILIASGQL